VNRLRQRRLNLILELTQKQAMILLIDETGDCKKGDSTDYVKRQYIGNVGKRENGIVVVTAYGLFKGMILPLCFEVYKPRERLKPGEVYQTKPQIASTMIRELLAMGFQFELVLADSLYGESECNFISRLVALKLPYIVAIRSNHGVWLPQDQEVTAEPWQTFKRTFSNGKTEVRYRREIIYGTRRSIRYWELTTDPQTLPDNSTVFVMSNQRGWKNLLNNLRLVVEPWISFNRLKRWLAVFNIPSLREGFDQLIEQMQQFYCPVIHDLLLRRILFNSA
jgi:SRSO17 transposase